MIFTKILPYKVLRYLAKSLINTLSPQTTVKVAIFIPILEMRKQWLREVKYFAWGHLAREWKSEIARTGSSHGTSV